MPVNNLQIPQPLSRYYTYEQVASQVAVLTNQADNEHVQWSNIRNHINMSLTKIVEMLNVSHYPFYGVVWGAALEGSVSVVHGLPWINLDTAVGGIRPSSVLSDLIRVSAKAQPALVPTADAWKEGNFKKVDLSQITQLASTSEPNVQWSDSIAWCLHGNELLLFIGSNIRTAINTNPTELQLPTTLTLFGYRQPILDDLLPTGTSVNYRSNVDLPDRYIDLLTSMAQKRVLEQMNAKVPESVQQNIAQELAKIDQNVVSQVQYEAQERNKARYGN